MPFLAGQVVTAGQMDRIQPRPYSAAGSGTVAAGSTNADVTGATITLTTQTANAVFKAVCVWDFNTTGVPGGSSTARLALDGVGQSPLATWRGDAANERGTVSQAYHGTVASAGSHTFKLIASTATNTEVLGANCSIVVEITEVV
ncbi:hypothetical protein ACFWZY_01490 [Streptomyces sp. NPDC058992]|uniref:hypothetical protein n=1 Tax=Streptomyces sp. NPDC058992 TaxID=3346688 RepID=UPI0036C8E4B7